MARIVLKPGRTAPSVYHHPWVFSGSVARIDGPCASGDVVDVVGPRNDFIARGLFSAQSQIAVRLVTWRASEAVDDYFFQRKVADAVRLRERFVPLSAGQTARRAVFSEADGLPGLIADQYGDWLVVQFLSFGLDSRRDIILDALARELHTTGIYERSDVDVRGKEGLTRRVGVAHGEEPPEKLVIRDGVLAYEIDVRTGQKTGHYLDQRENRSAAAALARGRRVLDAFSYSGGFGLAASLKGADEVVCADSSQAALDMARRNAELNGCTNVKFVRGDAGSFLREQSGEHFGLIVLDPPGFAKSSHNVEAALGNYTDLYAAAMRRLDRPGVLAACCCSQHIQPSQIVRALNAAAVAADRQVRIVESRGQPPDHPVAANCPETAYLKCLLCEVN